MTTDAETAVAQTYQEEWGRIVATLIRLFRDWDLAEDCAQEAFAQALRSLAPHGSAVEPRRLGHDRRAQPSP